MVTINLYPLKGSFVPKFRQIIFLSLSKMKELQIQRGSLVILSCVNGDILFKCWPLLHEESEAVLPSFAMFRHYTGFQQSIHLFKGLIFEAENVVFSANKYILAMDTEHFVLYIKGKLGHIYLKEGMILHLNYLGYSLVLTVQNIFSSISENKEIDSENKTFSNMNFPSLEDNFSEKFIITQTFGFQSSTPVSSLRNQMHGNANNSKMFYFLSKTTRCVIQNPNSEWLNNRSKIKDIAYLDEKIDIIDSSIRHLLNGDLAFGTRGILIIGPSGTGKSFLIDTIQNEYGNLLPLYNVKNIIFSSGLHLLKKFLKKTETELPSLFLVDDIDELCENKDLQSDFSSLIYKIMVSSAPILMIAACQNENLIPANLQKPGFMDEKIRFTIPSASDRVQIAEKNLKMYENNVTEDQMHEISDLAHGFTGGDIKRLCQDAFLKIIEDNSSEGRISFCHLQTSILNIKPSSMKKLSFEVPKVKWSDIGGMNEVKETVKEMVDWPLKHPDKLRKFKIIPPRGILLYGPPGCCKTMIAKALASESQLNFINIKSSQVFNMYVGESEKSVSELFKKARAAAPCILFLDEVDSLVPVRGSTSGNSNVTDRVVTQILVEIDGIDVLEQGVSVIAATNRPERIDPSLLRPGRLDRLIFIALPDANTRKEIFQLLIRKKPISSDIDIQYLVDKTANYTGAEISAVCLEASKSALKEGKHLCAPPINMKHFLTALQTVQPRTTQAMLDTFENYHNKFQFK